MTTTTDYNWNPKPDITLYELAMCLGPLLAATGGTSASIHDFIKDLPADCQRHFELIQDDE